MYVEQALKDHLLARSGLIAFIGERLYYINEVPQDVEVPYVVFFKVSAPREHSHDGASGLANARFQFSTFSETYYEAKQIAEQIQTALQGKHEVLGGESGVRCSILYDDENDFYENDLVHIAQDFIVIHKE